MTEVRVPGGPAVTHRHADGTVVTLKLGRDERVACTDCATLFVLDRPKRSLWDPSRGEPSGGQRYF